MRNPAGATSLDSLARISAASSGVTRSSASTDRIQSCAACAAAKFFCAPYPGQSLTMRRAPLALASSTVRSVLPQSTTSTSSAHATDARHASILAASSRVITVTETGGTVGDYSRRQIGQVRQVRQVRRVRQVPSARAPPRRDAEPDEPDEPEEPDEPTGY